MPDVLFFANAPCERGRFTTTDERVISVEDRGFQFGDAIYEVFKFLGRAPAFLSEHYRRLATGLAEIEIANPWPEESAFRDTIRELLARTAFDDGIVYIQVSRGEGERAHFWPDQLTPTAVAYSRRYNFPDAAKKERGIRVITAPDLRWKACNVKSVNLLANGMAKKRAQRAGADEALLLDDGVVREGASSSFFAVSGGRVITHPLDEHVLPGVVRDRVIDLAIAARIPVDERPLRDDQLLTLDEAFMTSTTQGVMPVTQIDGRTLGDGSRGEVTAKLQASFDQLEARSVQLL